MAFIHVDAGVAGDDGRALFGDPGADAVNVEIDVDTVGDRLVVTVLHDEVLVEEADGLAGRRGREPYNEGVEIEQHLAPQLVNRAVTLIHDDEVKELGWDAGIVNHVGRRALPRPGSIEGRRPAGRAGLVHHSDRGAQYVSIKYTERLAEAGIEPSVGSVGNSYDALAETINGLYKAEVIHRREPWRNFEAVEFATLEWVDWFNNRRLLEPIGFIPPAEAEERYFAMLNDTAMAA